MMIPAAQRRNSLKARLALNAAPGFEEVITHGL